MSDADVTHAYHEAGHAVAVACLGYKIIRATILSDGNRGGHIEHNCPAGSRDYAMVALAGGGCLRAFKLPSDGWGALFDEIDVENRLATLLPCGSDAERSKLEAQLCSEITKLFRRKMVRKAIQALVPKLLKHRTMDGHAVHAVLDSIIGAVPRGT